LKKSGPKTDILLKYTFSRYAQENSGDRHPSKVDKMEINSVVGKRNGIKK